MSLKTLMFLTATAGMVAAPLSAQAGGMGQIGTWGQRMGTGAGVAALNCKQGVSLGTPVSVNATRPMGLGNLNVSRPMFHGGNMNVSNNFGANRPSNWPAPSLGNTLLSYSSEPFEVDGTFVSDCRMPSDGIVEALYIIEDVGLRLVA